MPDLYAILGVKKNASAASIRKAYRKLAFELHPDRNSSDEAAARFKEVQTAWDVLGDPEWRKQYDETGDCSLKPDNSLGPIIMNLTSAMAHVLNVQLENDVDPKSENMVEKMRNVMATRREDLKKKLLDVQKGTRALNDILDRFTVEKGEENHLAAIARHHLAENEKTLKKLEAELAGLAAAQDFLKKYGFRWNRPEMGGLWINTSATNWSLGK